MHPSLSTPVRALAAALLIAASAQPSFAACTRLGFSVNDYGKDGPTQDAKGLLDKYIAKWATDHGVAKYRTGTKEVKCELFLNFIVFDEHTCRAEATVCWDGAPVTPAVKAEGAPAGDAKPAATAKAPAATVKRAAVIAPAKPAAAAEAAKPAAATAASPVVETGTLPAPAKPATSAPAPAAAAPKPAAASANEAALAAAQKAADAAERAAAAAERAAAAAQAAERASLPATAQKP